MTCIAYRKGVLAADSRLNWDDVYATAITKLVRLPDGAWMATAGSMVEGEKLRKWYERGANLMRYPKFQDMQALLLQPDGVLFMFDDTGGVRVEEGADHFVAIGSGAPSALGAMHMGADALRAVRIASHVDLGTGPPFTWVTRASEVPTVEP